MRIAVSGVNGFVGIHLTRELADHHHEVLGWSKGPVAIEIADLLTDYVDQDLTEAWPRGAVDAIIHLAGLSAVGPSFNDPQGYLQGNSALVTRLCEGLLADRRSPRLIVVSTGAVYAPGVRLTENSPTQASSPYVLSKLLVESQCGYYSRRGLDITIMRPFNHIGPGQQPGFLLPDLIAGITAGELTTGNLDTRRDYTDVRDVARAYRLAIEAETIDAAVLNICSGTSASGRQMLGLVAREIGVPVPSIAVDPGRLRPDDPAEISGDNTLICDVLGWTPKLGLEATVRDTIAVRS